MALNYALSVLKERFKESQFNLMKLVAADANLFEREINLLNLRLADLELAINVLEKSKALNN